MNYRDYYQKFNNNDAESKINYVPNSECVDFLMENAPRLYCPDSVIEETFAFRTWVMRKHIRKTEDGFMITEFLPDVYWAGKHNTINAPLIHHLNEFRWLKNADLFLDYIAFFLKGEGARYSYHVPALTEMYNYCILTGNTDFIEQNKEHFEEYFKGWEERHLTKNGLYWSIDDREGTEYSISGTNSALKFNKGLRPILNSCMYGDALTLSKIFKGTDKEKLYKDKANFIKKMIDERLWDGTFYKAVHPEDDNVDNMLTCKDIPKDCNALELMGYAPWMYSMPEKGKEFVFKHLKDESVFKAKTGLATADISHPRFLYPVSHKGCCWNGYVWPFATSIAINAVIELLNNYEQSYISNDDLYDIIKTYAQMHYLYEDGKKINFIDEVMYPNEYVWKAREFLKKKEDVPIIHGGKERGKDYNHSTFIDGVLRGLCGVEIFGTNLEINPKIKGIWKWFKIENLTFRKNTYNVYYDEDGTVFGKGKGVIIEEK
jgi:hypothetical protein